MGHPLPLSNPSNNNDCILNTLRSIISSEGISILDNPKRVKAFLSDKCSGERKREIVLLAYLLEEDVQHDLLRQKDTVPYDILSTNIKKKILINHPLDPNIVQTGIDILAIILGIIEYSPQSQVNTSTSQAHQLNQSKSYQEALEILNKVLEKEPNNALALREKGFALSNLGNYEESLQWYRLSIKSDPLDSSTWIFMGYALSKIERIEDAMHSYDQALKLDSNNAIAWKNKGFILAKLKDESGALRCYLQSLKINPDDYTTWNLLGYVEKDMNKKIEAFDKALLLNPQYIPAIINKAWVLSKSKKYQEALFWYEKALKIDRNNQKALKGKNYCLGKINNEETKTPFRLILIHTNPPGATVHIDGRYHGETPISRELSPGTHILKCSLSGYKEKVHQIDYQPTHKPLQININLERLFQSSLQIKSNVRGAAVYINGHYYGPVPYFIKYIAPGKYEIACYAQDFTEYKETVEIHDNEKKQIFAELKKNLIVESEPSITGKKPSRTNSQSFVGRLKKIFRK